MQTLSQTKIEIETDDEVRVRLIAAARDLAPRIAARAADNERARRISDETIAEAADAGFFKILVPKQRGGYQLDWETQCRVIVALGQGDGSVGWQLSFFILHNWLYLLLPEQAQQEIYGRRGFGIGPVLLAPADVKARKVEGGYILSGRSRWATGINHAEWILVGTKVEPEPGEEARTAMREFLVPRADVVVHDTWFTSGMCATGSHDVEYPDIFVPEYRTADLDASIAGNGLGFKMYDAPQYRVPQFVSMIFGATAPQVAIAKGAVDEFHKKVRGYVSPVMGTQTINNIPSLVRLAQAKVRVDAAEQYLYSLARRLLEWAAEGPLTPEQRVMVRAGCAWVANEAREIVQFVAATAGSSAFMRDQPMQRYLRDITMMANHFYFDQDTAFEPLGRVMVGLDANTRLS